mgnify:CR=1 FL=1
MTVNSGLKPDKQSKDNKARWKASCSGRAQKRTGQSEKFIPFPKLMDSVWLYSGFTLSWLLLMALIVIRIQSVI